MLARFINPDRGMWPNLTARATFSDKQIEDRVRDILSQVRERGDDALRSLAEQIDGVRLDSLQVTEQEIERARGNVSEELKEAIRTAIGNIAAFHRAQLREPVDMQTMPGVRCVQRTVPIQRIGLYVPGGSAPLFSTVLMLAVPARVAGCRNIVLCTPCSREGEVAAEVLYAAEQCGVDKIFKIGGAQAIAAMGYGTQTVPRVDKIFGPGNRYVTKAKQMLSVADVAIDMPAGPSEVMVLADDSADAAFVASDLLSQAEHGPDSQALLVCDSVRFAEQVERQLERQLAALPRAGIASRALENSRAIVFDSKDDMVDFANAYGAEHLIISMHDAWKVAGRITAAGSVFIGNYSPESAGDYASGTNHTLPTCGWASAFSGVNTDSFVRKITYQELSREGLAALAPTITAMAEAEGLDAHGRAVKIRLCE